MNFLFDNPLANMYGPYYLVFYVFAIAFLSIIFAVMKRLLDYSDRLPLPPVPPDPDPFEIAFLRGGENEIARAIVFSLTRKGLIQVTADDKTARIEPSGDSGANFHDLSQMERAALGWLRVSREPKEIFDRKNGLVKVLEPYCRVYESSLARSQMLVGSPLSSTLKPFKYLFAATILTLGAYRLVVALIIGRTNVFGLIAVAVIGLLVFSFVAKLPRLTKLGKSYLERLQLAFDDLKTEAQKPLAPATDGQTERRAAFGGVDPILLSVGVFGSAVLAGTMYDDYNRAFQRSQAGAAGCGSSCGTSCGSSDSSTSSDGGSSCGSGCGGCGGGD